MNKLRQQNIWTGFICLSIAISGDPYEHDKKEHDSIMTIATINFKKNRDFLIRPNYGKTKKLR
jgi:hypothetical protein